MLRPSHLLFLLIALSIAGELQGKTLHQENGLQAALVQKVEQLKARYQNVAQNHRNLAKERGALLRSLRKIRTRYYNARRAKNILRRRYFRDQRRVNRSRGLARRARTHLAKIKRNLSYRSHLANRRAQLAKIRRRQGRTHANRYTRRVSIRRVVRRFANRRQHRRIRVIRRNQLIRHQTLQQIRHQYKKAKRLAIIRRNQYSRAIRIAKKSRSSYRRAYRIFRIRRKQMIQTYRRLREI